MRSDPAYHQVYLGYKIVGDNIDKNIRPRYQTMERQTKSVHYFHSYAVMDRVPSLYLSDAPPALPTNKRVDLDRIMPSESCNRKLSVTFATLISR